MKCRRRMAFWVTLLIIVPALYGSGLAQPSWVLEAAKRGASVTPHKDASLLILLDSVVGKIGKKGDLVLEVRRAARVLDTLGAGLAILVEPLTTTRKVKNLKGWKLRPDGSAMELPRECVMKRDLNQRTDIYDDVLSLVASFKDVSPGDIIAYEYTVKDDDPFTSYYTDFQFQLNQPVVSARFEVEIPPDWKLLTFEQQAEPVTYTSEGDKHIWTAENLDYRPTEPYMPPWSQLVRRVSLGCFDDRSRKVRGFADWNTAVTWQRALYDAACADTVPLVKTVERLCGGVNSPTEKLNAIAKWVQEEIKYIAVWAGDHRFQPRKAGLTLKNKFGDCKDKATLMRAMLALVGIPSEAVAARISGGVEPDFPCPFQFDHIIVAIPVKHLPDLPQFPNATVGGWLYFDPTNDAIPLGSLSATLRGSYVLKLSPGDTALTQLPALTPADRKCRFRAVAELSTDLSMCAEVSIVTYGIWGAQDGHIQELLSGREMAGAWQKRFAQVVENPILTDCSFGADSDSSWLSFVLSASHAATLSGTSCLLTTDFFHYGHVDDLSSPERVYPITFGTPADITTDIEWRLPPSWTPVGDPRHISDSCKLASLSCDVTHDNGLHLISRTIYFGGEIPPEQYDEARRMNKSLKASLRLTTLVNRTVQ